MTLKGNEEKGNQIYRTPLIVYVVFEYSRPKPVNWQITYSKFHKIPFGSFITEDILSTHFDGLHVDHSYLTAYEILGTLDDTNLLIIAGGYFPDPEDMNATLDWVADGATLFIAAEHLEPAFADTLGIGVEDSMLDTLFLKDFKNFDSTFLQFVNPQIETSRFWYAEPHVYRYFNEIDTLATTVLAANEDKMPVFIQLEWGNGQIYLCSTPIAFTNFYLLKNDNYKFADYAFSYLEEKDIHWTEYYQLGRMEPLTPIRFILKEPSLKWAYYILVTALLLFIIFEAKRKQRIIPVIEPLRNATRDFARTVGNLYMHHNDHKNAAEKKITYFYSYIRSHYFLTTHLLDEEFYDRFAHKSGKDRNTIDGLFKLIIHLQSKKRISKDQLLELSLKIDEFYTRH